jgi:hypothetical protein
MKGGACWQDEDMPVAVACRAAAVEDEMKMAVLFSENGHW